MGPKGNKIQISFSLRWETKARGLRILGWIGGAGDEILLGGDAGGPHAMRGRRLILIDLDNMK